MPETSSAMDKKQSAYKGTRFDEIADGLEAVLADLRKDHGALGRINYGPNQRLALLIVRLRDEAENEHRMETADA